MSTPAALADFVPIGIDDAGRVVLELLGPVPFDEPFFDLTVRAVGGRPRVRLDPEDLLAAQGARPVPAVIVHQGRCGSTLLCRLLDASGRALTFREPDVVLDAARVGSGVLAAVLAQFSWAASASGRHAVVKLPSHAVGLGLDLRGGLAVPGARPAVLAVVRSRDDVVASSLADPPMWGVPRSGELDRGRLAAAVDGVWSEVARAVLTAGCPAIGYGDLVLDPAGVVGDVHRVLGLPAPDPLATAAAVRELPATDAKRGGAFLARARDADELPLPPPGVRGLEDRLGRVVRLDPTRP